MSDIAGSPRAAGMTGRVWLLRGIVQGGGVRPALLRWAAACSLRGTIGNTREGLELRLEGAERSLLLFRETLSDKLPAGCVVCVVEEQVVKPRGCDGLAIVGRGDANAFPLATHVPPDRALCAKCRHEMRDVDNRRHGYPWITCAHCGPRYSLVVRMPFERVDTAMRPYGLCDDCVREYATLDDRRFHAQTVSCQACGPRWWAVDARGNRHEGGKFPSPIQAGGDEATRFAVRLLEQGAILALRGVGGYQLLCDATNERAVRRLRDRKQRPTKPFAVMVADPQAARRVAILDDVEERQLVSAANPIVLVAARRDASLAASVHPGLHDVGLMLPSTAMHSLLVEAVARPLVCTSANVAEQPLLFRVEDAQRELAGITDGWLHHDREIVHPVDDSVVRCIAGRAVTLRLGRGLAPLPLELPSLAPRLALGAHLKSAVACANGRVAALGPHIGDLETLGTRERFRQRCDSFLALYGCMPEEILHDAHPDYASTREAMRRSAGVTTRAVQHHVAHVSAGILEHQLWNQLVLGVAWDGAGYGVGHGEDGATRENLVWGGEFLRVDAVGSWTRAGWWRPFELPGGDVATRQPWRVAIAILRQVVSCDEWLPIARERFAGRPIDQLVRWLDQAAPLVSQAQARQDADAARWFNSTAMTRTTSVGRLFDAAAAWILGAHDVNHEGEAAMWLESIADRNDERSYPVPLRMGSDGRVELDWRPMFAALWRDLRCGETPGRTSMRFHRSLARAIMAVSELHAGLPVVLSGGVFQNRLLGETLLEMTPQPDRFRLPGHIPPNDGGIAAGQLAFASLGIGAWDGEARSR